MAAANNKRLTGIGLSICALAVQVILNSGVWGGSKAAVQDLLAGMLSEFSVQYSRTARQGNIGLQNFNMAVLNNVILHETARTWNIFTGRPFCAGQVSTTPWGHACMHTYA